MTTVSEHKKQENVLKLNTLIIDKNLKRFSIEKEWKRDRIPQIVFEQTYFTSSFSFFRFKSFSAICGFLFYLEKLGKAELKLRRVKKKNEFV